MHDVTMMAQVVAGAGFFAALDQSGGSTPHALNAYGLPDSAWSSDEEMFGLMHAMRVRIMTAPSFTGRRILGAILFERTMDGEAEGRPVPRYLWEERRVVPFLKVDQGLEEERDGVQLMKPIAGLDGLLDRAHGLGVFGTKMRSVVRLPDARGIETIADQQFELAERILAHGLLPILEPEVLIKSPERDKAESLLRDALLRRLDALDGAKRVMLKLTIPETPDAHLPLIAHPRVARVVALSGGFERDDACRRLALNHGIIASFSRALVEELTHGMTDEEFDGVLEAAISEIYHASVDKQ